MQLRAECTAVDRSVHPLPSGTPYPSVRADSPSWRYIDVRYVAINYETNIVHHIADTGD